MPNSAQRLRFPVAINAVLGRFKQEPDYEKYLQQLIQQVIFTAPGERINRPQFGAGVRRLIFAPNNFTGASLARTLIYQSLNTWLNTLLKVNDVVTSSEQEKLLIGIDYTVLQRNERRYLNLEVTL